MMNTQTGKKNKAILLVEDDNDDSEIIEQFLKRSGISNPVYRARDGIEAVEMLREMTCDEKLGRPFLLLVDIYMPRMNGLQFLETVRVSEELKDNMAFIITTSSWVRDKVLAYRLNVAGYILKDHMHGLAGCVSHYCATETLSRNASDTFNEYACFTSG